MYVKKEDAKKKLNLSEEEFNLYKNFNQILYSEKTDKYEPNSILEKRTLTLGLDKLLSPERKEEIINKMKNYSSFKFKLFKNLQQDSSIYSNSGANRLHREIGKSYGFGAHISDSALSAAAGIVKSTNTWYKKRIENLEKKIDKIKNFLEKYEKSKEKKFHKDFIKGKRKQLIILQNRLNKYKSKSYIPIHFGKHSKTIEEYRRNRLEYFSSGSASAKGNPEIRLEYMKNSEEIKLKLFDLYFNIDIPNSHEKTFSLNHFNCQACRISFNKKGKLVLNITYSYIKPIEQRRFKPSKGTIGIDIGPKEIAVCLVKKDGNPFKYVHFSTGNLLDKRTEETEREISLILDKIITLGEEHGFTKITIENLNFKQEYEHRSPRLNRILKKFPSRKFEELITSKCLRRGIELNTVNPAYTSVIGIYKYSNRDNLSSSHNSKSKDLSAALAIGRRGLGMREKAIVCIKVSRTTKSLKLRSLFPESEKEGKTLTKKEMEEKSSKLSLLRGRCNWNLWNKLKRKYTLRELTATLFGSEEDNSL